MLSHLKVLNSIKNDNYLISIYENLFALDKETWEYIFSNFPPKKKFLNVCCVVGRALISTKRNFLSFTFHRTFGDAFLRWTVIWFAKHPYKIFTWKCNMVWCLFSTIRFVVCLSEFYLYLGNCDWLKIKFIILSFLLAF